ncbi:MAG: hypothetical protein U9Q98_00710 [Bacteroidota bacterium]|nr:hypothetical protein [Bacteroidota bacterium]
MALSIKNKNIDKFILIGDKVLKSGFEIEFNNEKYIILPHSAILMLIRDEGLFE